MLISPGRSRLVRDQTPQSRVALLRLAASVVVCACIPVLCGILFGYSGSDTQYHMGSWVDMVSGWKSGVFLPGWAEHANYGFGDPRFCFYPLLPIVFGSLLLYALPVQFVMGTLFFLNFAIAGFAMFGLARRFVSERRALVAAVLYETSYFLLITALKHAALAELMADAFLPLLVGCFTDVLVSGRRRSWPWLVALLTLVWLVDVPIAIGTAYLFSIASILVVSINKQWRSLIWVFAAEAVALVAAAFYLLPALMARHTILSTDRLEYHLRTLFSSHVLQDMTLSVDALALFAVVAWAGWRWRGRAELQAASVVLLLGAIALFFQLPLSRPFWHLPQMHLVGFPHRFQVFLAIALPIAVVIRTTRRVMAITILLYLAAAVVPFYALYTWTHRTGPLPTAQRLFSKSLVGYQGAPEYVPRGTGALLVNEDNQQLGLSMPEVQAAGQSCTAQVTVWQPERRVIHVVDNAGSCLVSLRLFLHPFWYFSVDRGAVAAIAGRYGMATVAISPGQHDIFAHFQRPVGPIVAGWAVTLLGGMLVLLGMRMQHSSKWGLTMRKESEQQLD